MKIFCETNPTAETVSPTNDIVETGRTMGRDHLVPNFVVAL
jgi:hypothetical protein